MGRWQPDAKGRLAQAALELFGERGFEHTTVAEIAGRAGLTERTFFRHFADKREVLFGGGQLDELIASAVAAAPADATPVEATMAGLDAVAAVLAERRDFARRRQWVVAASAELRERELIKLASWAERLAKALRERGVDPATATLAGELGIAVFRVAFQRWVDGPEDADLPALIRAALGDLQALTT